MFEADREQMLDGFADFGPDLLGSITAHVLVVAAARHLGPMYRTLPWLLAFLDAEPPD